ncbi:MAG: prepilin-type N-terminal cleavage/methylation domain-containing protein [Verrucomicrobiia bacterium]|jgi:prepilin-type N-terminal cleavage/methylation domain-containing protein
MTKPRTHGFTRRRLWDGPAPTGQSGFTLVELISVLVILAILLSIALPTVTNLAKANAVSSAARQVSNTLNLARQYAITHRTYARVVFPYSGTGSQPNMWYCTYAVMTNSVTSNPLGWIPVTKWEYLPTGAVFLNNATGITPGNLGALNDNAHSLNQQVGLPFAIPGNGGNVGTFAYIEFGPTGAATPVSIPPGSGTVGSTLAITEGFITSGSTATPVPTTTKTSGGTLANLTTISVDTIVGHIQVIHP